MHAFAQQYERTSLLALLRVCWLADANLGPGTGTVLGDSGSLFDYVRPPCFQRCCAAALHINPSSLLAHASGEESAAFWRPRQPPELPNAQLSQLLCAGQHPVLQQSQLPGNQCAIRLLALEQLVRHAARAAIWLIHCRFCDKLCDFSKPLLACLLACRSAEQNIPPEGSQMVCLWQESTWLRTMGAQDTNACNMRLLLAGRSLPGA